MNIGVSTASFYPLETEDALREIGEMGIKTTEIFFNSQSELKEPFIDLLCDIKEEYGISVKAVHPTMSLAEPFVLFSNYDRRFYEGLDSYARYSEIAAELGAQYIILHGGRPNNEMEDEEYCERYMQLKNVTLKNGVTVLQENVAKYRSGDIEFLRSMRDILGKDAEFCFDVKQAIRCGNNPMEMLKEFQDNIYHYHISDHSISSDCMLPGNGGFDFSEFFKSINNSENKAFVIEVYRNAYKNFKEIENSFEFLLKQI